MFLADVRKVPMSYGKIKTTLYVRKRLNHVIGRAFSSFSQLTISKDYRDY